MASQVFGTRKSSALESGKLRPGQAGVPERTQGSQLSAPLIVQDVLNRPGQPLDASTRGFFESRFGHDFRRVRIHADAEAAESARATNSMAYTVGHHVVFGSDQFTPGTPSGRKLLAHELAHTIQQQRGGAVPDSRSSAPQERGADAASEAIAAGLSAVTVQGTSGLGIARKPIAAPEKQYVELSSSHLGVLRGMEAELKNARLRPAPATSIQQEAARTFAIIKVVDQDGSVKQSGVGEFLGGKGPHAESLALRQVSTKEVLPTDTILLMVDQLPCENLCTPAINRFRKSVRAGFRVFTKAEVDPETREVTKGIKSSNLQASEKNLEVAELLEFTRPTELLEFKQLPEAATSSGSGQPPSVAQARGPGGTELALDAPSGGKPSAPELGPTNKAAVGGAPGRLPQASIGEAPGPVPEASFGEARGAVEGAGLAIANALASIAAEAEKQKTRDAVAESWKTIADEMKRNPDQGVVIRATFTESLSEYHPLQGPFIHANYLVFEQIDWAHGSSPSQARYQLQVQGALTPRTGAGQVRFSYQWVPPLQAPVEKPEGQTVEGLTLRSTKLKESIANNQKRVDKLLSDKDRKRPFTLDPHILDEPRAHQSSAEISLKDGRLPDALRSILAAEHLIRNVRVQLDSYEVNDVSFDPETDVVP